MQKLYKWSYAWLACCVIALPFAVRASMLEGTEGGVWLWHEEAMPASLARMQGVDTKDAQPGFMLFNCDETRLYLSQRFLWKGDTNHLFASGDTAYIAGTSDLTKLRMTQLPNGQSKVEREVQLSIDEHAVALYVDNVAICYVAPAQQLTEADADAATAIPTTQQWSLVYQTLQGEKQWVLPNLQMADGATSELQWSLAKGANGMLQVFVQHGSEVTWFEFDEALQTYQFAGTHTNVNSDMSLQTFQNVTWLAYRENNGDVLVAQVSKDNASAFDVVFTDVGENWTLFSDDNRLAVFDVDVAESGIVFSGQWTRLDSKQQWSDPVAYEIEGIAKQFAAVNLIPLALQGISVAMMIIALLFFLRRKPEERMPVLPSEMLPAPMYMRIFAVLIDMFLIFTVLEAVLKQVAPELAEVELSPNGLLHYNKWLIENKNLLIFGLSFWWMYTLYTTVAEIICGKTIGKAIFKLTVVNIFGAKPKVSQILVRNVYKPFEIFLFIPVFIMIFTPFLQRCGDLGANTLVAYKPRSNKDSEEQL